MSYLTNPYRYAVAGISHSSTTYTNDDPNATGHKIYGSIVALGFNITSMWADPTAPKCVTFVMGAVGTPPTANFTVKIYDGSGTLKDTSSDSYPQTGVPTGGAKTAYKFDLSGVTLSNGYKVAIIATGTDNNNAIYVHQYYDGTSRNTTDGLEFVYSDATPTWYSTTSWNPDVSVNSVSC